jgi:DNA-binding LacI/PurR family transcriptional regulator
MADIARLAGVSTSTVSRALNGSELVNHETRQRIGDLARSLNYSINVSAKNLRLRNNRTVTVVVPRDASRRQDLAEPYFMSLLGSLADVLSERGYDMLLSRVDAERLDLAAASVDSGQSIGVIILGNWPQLEPLNELARRRVPFVAWGPKLPTHFYTTVAGDNREGGRLATQHLIDMGCRDIAFLGDRNVTEVALRFEGYQLALGNAALPFRESLVVAASLTENSGHLGVRELLHRMERFDAIFATSDWLAVTAIHTLRKEGMQVPGDVAVVGYDDIPLAAHSHPPLSSVRQPLTEAGVALVDSLSALLEGQTTEAMVLANRLVVRESSKRREAT